MIGATLLIARTPLEIFSNDTPVGLPKAEAEITEALLRHLPKLLTAGRGRELIALTEVGLGRGRPDLILLAASRRGLEARQRSGLRLRTFTDAEILTAAHAGVTSRHTPGHERATLRYLTSIGWRPERTLDSIPRLVSDSILIEAKVNDWKSGIAQLARARWSAHRGALALPTGTIARVSRSMLRKNRLGLLAIAQEDQQVAWRRQAPARTLKRAADLWLSELAVRALEGA